MQPCVAIALPYGVHGVHHTLLKRIHYVAQACPAAKPTRRHVDPTPAPRWRYHAPRSLWVCLQNKTPCKSAFATPPQSNRLVEAPAWLAGLTALEHVALRHNQLTSIPPFVLRLRHLLELHLCGNNLRAVPDVPPSLQYVAHTICAWTLAFFNNTSHPRVIDLSNNDLVEVPPSLFTLPTLRTLCLDGNALVALPDSVSRATALRELQLGGNALTALPPYAYVMWY